MSSCSKYVRAVSLLIIIHLILKLEAISHKLVPKCLTDISALVPKCSSPRSEVSQVRSDLGPNCLYSLATSVTSLNDVCKQWLHLPPLLQRTDTWLQAAYSPQLSHPRFTQSYNQITAVVNV